MKKLVAYYSRPGENYFGGRYQVVTVGNTEKVARMIANEVSADLYRIEQAIPYSEKYQECIDQAKRDQRAHSRPAVSNLPSNIDEYDEVYLGIQSTGAICPWPSTPSWRITTGTERRYVHSAHTKEAA